jgi:SulP family sulfate permease
VALVSIPLSTALTIASGAKPMMGLTAAVYGPMIAGIIGGSHYNILGPAGALVNILHKLVMENGVEIIPLVAFFSGIISFIVYLLKLEKFFTIIPLSVLEGFSFGVALTIGLNQFNFAFGLYTLHHHSEFYLNVFETWSNVGSLSWNDFIPFLIFFITLYCLTKFMKGNKPWIIPIAIFGIIYGFITYKFFPDFKPALLFEKFPEMASNPRIMDFTYMENEIKYKNIFIGSLKVAFVAVLETLISARIADNRTGTRFDQSKEVLALGVANMFSGAMGGTPCTGVLVRTAVNISSGATHKTSQFINAIVVMIMIFAVMPVFTFIPMPVIASILVCSAWRLIPF